ncbi:MAG: hypothetical protein ACXW3H_05105, partial [Candidatus Aminicenantales bacterium]
MTRRIPLPLLALFAVALAVPAVRALEARPAPPRALAAKNDAIELERARADDLLKNILPAATA